jgi:hypothetical protein
MPAARRRVHVLAAATPRVTTPHAHAAFLGQTCRITFDKSRDAEQIFEIGPDGVEPRNLTKSSPSNLTPAYSSDGRRIALGGFRAWDPATGGDPGNSRELNVMGADGSGARRVTPLLRRKSS